MTSDAEVEGGVTGRMWNRLEREGVETRTTIPSDLCEKRLYMRRKCKHTYNAVFYVPCVFVNTCM